MSHRTKCAVNRVKYVINSLEMFFLHFVHDLSVHMSTVINKKYLLTFF